MTREALILELRLPVTDERMAIIPYPMTEEDYDMLLKTLALWKARLIRPQPPIDAVSQMLGER